MNALWLILGVALVLSLGQLLAFVVDRTHPRPRPPGGRKPATDPVRLAPVHHIGRSTREHRPARDRRAAARARPVARPAGFAM